MVIQNKPRLIPEPMPKCSQNAKSRVYESLQGCSRTRHGHHRLHGHHMNWSCRSLWSSLARGYVLLGRSKSAFTLFPCYFWTKCFELLSTNIFQDQSMLTLSRSLKLLRWSPPWTRWPKLVLVVSFGLPQAEWRPNFLLAPKTFDL